jgi:hypothetical protein
VPEEGRLHDEITSMACLMMIGCDEAHIFTAHWRWRPRAPADGLIADAITIGYFNLFVHWPSAEC